MQTRLLKSILLASLAALVVVPAAAQASVDVGPIHIRIANSPPPRAQYEHRPAQPYPDALWIKGYWHRDDDRWAWQQGRWERRHDRNVRWIPARYVREGCPWYRKKNCGWRYEPAHWSNQRLVEGDDYRQWREERYGRH